MIKKIYLIFIIFLLILTPTIFADNYVVSSGNYSFTMHTLGIDGALIQGSSLSARELITPFQPGTKDASSLFYIVNIGFFGNTSSLRNVAINSYSIYPTSAVNGSIIRFGISAQNAQSLWLKINLPDSSNEIINLTNNDFAYYLVHQIGRHNIIFYANDSSGAIASAADHFDITSPVVVSIGSLSAGGRGGGGGGGAGCNYFWNCAPWGICDNAQQTRICKNTGTCTGTKDKPIESRACTEALFDVVLNLSNLELTEKEKLKFNINLIQTKNIEKIDVQVKYTIIDSNKKELFSQIETRAVQTDLSYAKTIEELTLLPGKYNLKVDIIYGDKQRASAEQTFTVKSNKQIEITKPIIFPVEQKPSFFQSLLIKIPSWVLDIILLLIVGLIILALRKFILNAGNLYYPILRVELYNLTNGERKLIKSFNSKITDKKYIQVKEGNKYGFFIKVDNGDISNYDIKLSNKNNYFEYHPHTKIAAIKFKKLGKEKIVCKCKDLITGKKIKSITIKVKVLSDSPV